MNSPKTLKDLLVSDFEDPEMQVLYGDIFGKCSALEVQERVFLLVEPLIGKVESCLFAAISIGAVFGFQTTEGGRAVFKVYPKRFSKEALEAIHHCQKKFFGLG